MPPENEGTTSAAPSAPAEPASTTEPVNLQTPTPPEAGATDQIDDLEDVEYEGANYRVPKPLKKGIMLHADYTRKTQEVSETRKALDTREQDLTQQAASIKEHRQELGQLAAVENQIAQFQNVDWDAWDMQDPPASARGWRQYQQLQEAKGTLEAKLADRERQRGEKAQQDTAKRLSDTRAYAEKNIKGWTPELDSQIVQHAIEDLGYTRDELVQLVNPKTYRTLHQSWLYAQSSKQQQANAPTTPPIQPMERVASRSSPGAKKALTDPSLSMEEYARRRAAGERG